PVRAGGPARPGEGRWPNAAGGPVRPSEAGGSVRPSEYTNILKHS
ncbi:uncharacterized, partial [Tachysurus ichikawai]